MWSYLNLLQDVLDHGQEKTDPQGIGNIAVCGRELRFKLDDGFPLITTRSLKSSWKAARAELLWFLSGSTRVEDLWQNDVHIWDQWADRKTCTTLGLETGDLGPIYGRQWRSFNAGPRRPISEIAAEIAAIPRLVAEGYEAAIRALLELDLAPVDQISILLSDLTRNPDSRRLVVTGWNPLDIDRVFIAPCHCFFRCFHAQGQLSLHVFQRSADLPIGIPFDIAEYALLLMMLAQVTGLHADELVYTMSDTHIYKNQIDGVKQVLTREPRPLPTVTLNPAVTDLFAFTLDDFVLEGYDPHPPIKFPVGY